MKREKEVEELKLIIAENMAKYSKAGMPYEEALKMCALGILASGFGKADELNDEIAGLTGKVEALQQDNENLRRTLEEGREAVDEAKRKTAEDIVDLLIQYDDGDNNTEAVELIVEHYGLRDYIKENFSVQFDEEDEGSDK